MDGSRYLELEKHGVATFVRKSIVQGLMKGHKGYKIMSSPITLGVIKEHLRRRGINPQKRYTLSRYVKKLENHKEKKGKTY